MAFRVLVVDDETGIREAIRMTLEYEGYRVDEARSGNEGLEKAEKTPYDAILLDIKMPVLDGMEVLENLKDKKIMTPVVMVSGHGDISTAVEATKRGAFDFLEKPLARDRVLLVVKNAVEWSELQRENQRYRELVGPAPKMIGSAPVFLQAVQQATQVARSRILKSGGDRLLGLGELVLAA